MCIHNITIKDDQTKCEITDCGNPQPEFCIYACPLVHGHKPEDSLAVFTQKKHGIKPGEKKAVPVRAKAEKVAEPVYRSLVSFIKTCCSGCPNGSGCKVFAKFTNETVKCGCGDKVKVLINDCPDKVYCKAITDNWKQWRGCFSDIYEKMDNRLTESRNEE